MNRVYIGQRRQYGGFYAGGQQRGGNIFGTIGRFLRPLAKTFINWVKPHAKRAARNLGTTALKTGSRVVQDVMEGKNIKSSLKQQGKRGVGEFLTTQFGRGRKRGRSRSRSTTAPRRKKARRKTQKGGGCGNVAPQTGGGRRKRSSSKGGRRRRKPSKPRRKPQKQRRANKKKKKKSVSFGKTIF